MSGKSVVITGIILTAYYPEKLNITDVGNFIDDMLDHERAIKFIDNWCNFQSLGMFSLAWQINMLNFDADLEEARAHITEVLERYG